MQRKLWQLSPCDKDLAAQLSEDCGMDPISDPCAAACFARHSGRRTGGVIFVG